MSLELLYHPLSSFCHKAQIALYENGAPVTLRLVNLGDPADRDALKVLWPIGKFPVLQDLARGQVVAETSIIIEYLDQHYPGATRFIPEDRDAARAVRALDRFYDLNVQVPMQKIVGDRIRPADKKDPLGVEQARAHLETALDMVEREIGGREWAAGDAFTMADCAAAPALYYANRVRPYAESHPQTMAYFERVKRRPSYARVLEEAAPFLHMFPEG